MYGDGDEDMLVSARSSAYGEDPYGCCTRAGMDDAMTGGEYLWMVSFMSRDAEGRGN